MSYKFDPIKGELYNGRISTIITTIISDFSYKVIVEDMIVTIPKNQQMLVKGMVDIEGEIKIIGELVII